MNIKQPSVRKSAVVFLCFSLFFVIPSECNESKNLINPKKAVGGRLFTCSANGTGYFGYEEHVVSDPT